MADKANLVHVEIFGQSYALRAGEDPAYLERLAGFVDKHMKDVAATAGAASMGSAGTAGAAVSAGAGAAGGSFWPQAASTALSATRPARFLRATADGSRHIPAH